MKHVWLVILMELMLSSENHTTAHDNTTPERTSISVEAVTSVYTDDYDPLALENLPLFSSADFLFDHGLFQEYRGVVGELIDESYTTAMSTEATLNLLTEQEIDPENTMFDQWNAESAESHASLERQRFEITEQTLQELKEAGVPEPILYQLTQMQGQQFDDQEIFWRTVERYVDETTLPEYQSVIFTHAAANIRRPSFYYASSSNTSFSAYHSQQSQQNKAAWDLLLYYPRTARKAFGKAPPRKTSYSLEEQKGVFRILTLLKRWGVPKPSTLILIALGLYLLLALLSRRR